MYRILAAALVLSTLATPLLAQQEVEITLLDAPDFKSAPVKTSPPNPPITLRRISEKANQITDSDAWFSTNKLALNTFNGELPSSIPGRIRNASVLTTIESGDHLLVIYGENYGSKSILLGATRNGTIEYILDFAKYRFAPRNVEKDREFVEQSIVWAEQRGDTLYVSHGHSTYAASSYGMNAYVTAIDTKTKKALWHSAPLVSNASNFTFIGGDAYLLTGYGFTAEPDFVYILRAKDGAVVARIPVKSGPEHLIGARNRIFVRTYNRDYVFEVPR